MRSFPLLLRSPLRRPPSRACLAAVLALALPGANTLVAQFYIGPDNGSWFNAAHWDSGVPESDGSATAIVGNEATAVIGSSGVSLDFLLLGFYDAGRVRVENGATGASNSVQLGAASQLTVTGADSAWTTSHFSIDATGDLDHLVVSHGGLVTVSSLTAGSFDGVGGNLLVTGANSQLVDQAESGHWGLTLGSALGSAGSLTISAGGSVVSSGTVAVGYSGTGDVLLTGEGSSWTVNNTIQLGYDTTGVGSITVAAGATGSSAELNIGYYYGTGAFTITGAGSQWSTPSFQVTRGTFTLENGGVLRVGDGEGTGISYDDSTMLIGNGANAGHIEGGWLNYGSIVLDHTDTATVFTGYVTNLGTIEKNGPGTSIFAGDYASLDTGSVTLNAGTLQFGNGGELGDVDGTFTSASGATLAFDSSSNLSFTGVLSGSGSLLQSGTGRLTLTGNQTYTGSTTIDAGTLSISADGRLGTAPVSATPGHLVLDGGTLRTTATMTLNARRGIALGAGGGTFQTTGTLTYAGVIAGSGGLTKTGNGTLVLNGANLYSGDTAITRGAVRIGNTSGSAFGTGDVTVSSNATLTGAGSFTGALTNHGTFSPGDDFALLTLSNFTQSATGTLILELGGLGRGLEYDALNITGTFSAGGTLRVLLSESFAPTNGDYFDLLDWTTFNGTFAQLDLPSLGGGLFWDDTAFYTSGIVTVAGLGSPIPEPSTYAILAGTATLAFAAWRRRLAHRRAS